MKLTDMIGLGLDNLRRAKLRTSLTILGVVIGIGALTSMISFGTGMQKNITDTFKQNDLFTSLYITSKEINIDEMASGDLSDMADMLRGPTVPLTDSTLQKIQSIPGVEIAFPEIRFPVKVRIGDHETRTHLQALPAAMASYKPYDEMMAGRFFSHDTSSACVLRWETLKQMGVIVHDGATPVRHAGPDSLQKVTVVAPDSIIGKSIEVVSAALDATQFPSNPMLSLLNPPRSMFAESVTELAVSGILKQAGAFSGNRLRGGMIVPLKTAERVPRLGFSSVWELLGDMDREGVYNSIYVRLKGMRDMDTVRGRIEKMGLHVFSITDQLEDIKRGFLIMDAILGAIGTIALVVAALGIINTMVMSILERTREIGIMKAIGGSETEIRTIFFMEAGTIGFIGAVFGLVLGWLVTRVANVIANTRFLPAGEPSVDFFYFPLWLILGAIVFSLVISLSAGLYPANRAARVNPVEALRHD
jgi:putative ABC transport system permease protein